MGRNKAEERKRILRVLQDVSNLDYLYNLHTAIYSELRDDRTPEVSFGDYAGRTSAFLRVLEACAEFSQPPCKKVEWSIFSNEVGTGCHLWVPDRDSLWKRHASVYELHADWTVAASRAILRLLYDIPPILWDTLSPGEQT